MESALIPVMAAEGQPAGAAARRAMRECSTCHKKSIPYWTTQHIKNCSDCRENNRRKSKLAEERRAQRQAIVAQMSRNAQKAEQGYDDGDDDEVENIQTFSQTTSAPPVLRPAHENSQPVYKPTTYQYVPIPQTSHTMSVSARGAKQVKRPKIVQRAVADDLWLNDLDANEHDLAMEQMKQRLAATVKANRASAAIRASGTSRQGSDGREYQTASALYESLKRRAQRNVASQKKCTFHGYHAIVANENIDNAKRIELVTNDLRKIARLPFDHTHPARTYDPHTHARTTSFRCTCLGYEAAKPQPLASKGTLRDLIKTARHANTASLEPTPRLCGGKVTITAVADNSHPLPLLGQRIIVRVDHKL